jgi:hypothetical protein
MNKTGHSFNSNYSGGANHVCIADYFLHKDHEKHQGLDRASNSIFIPFVAFVIFVVNSYK